MTLADVSLREKQSIMGTYRRYPVLFVQGSGSCLYDDDGREYLDFVAGVATCNAGHSHPKVTEAVAAQAGTLSHTSNLYYTRPVVALAEQLSSLLQDSSGVGGWKLFFGNSGAEAGECAAKLVRKYAFLTGTPKRGEIVCAWKGFHGRTLAMLAATGQPEKWKHFEPVPDGFTHADYDDVGAIRDRIGPDTGALMLEPVQGEAGVRIPRDGYFGSVAELSRENNIVFIDDEIQTGLGRTGYWFGFEHDRAVPDVVTLAKALGNGMPIGVAAARGAVAEAFEPGDHASTLGGSPLACAASLAVLDVMKQEDLPARAAETGRYLVSGLQELVKNHSCLQEVRGRGLLIGLQLGSGVSREICEAALRAGLVVNDVQPDVVRLCPPLTVTNAECDRALEILDEVFGVFDISAQGSAQ